MVAGTHKIYVKSGDYQVARYLARSFQTNRLAFGNQETRLRRRASKLVALPKNNSVTKSLSFERILEVIWFKLKHQEISKADAIRAIALFLNIPIPNLVSKGSSSLSYLVKSKTDVMNIYKCNKPELHSYNLINLLINPPVATLKKDELALIRELRYRNNLELAVAALMRRGQYIYKPISVDKDFKLEILPFETISVDDVHKASAWNCFDYAKLLPRIFSELKTRRMDKSRALEVLYSLFELKLPAEEVNLPRLLLCRVESAKNGPLDSLSWPDPEIACAELIKLVVDTPVEFQNDSLILELKEGHNLELAIRALRTNTKYEPNTNLPLKPINPALEILIVPELVPPQAKPREPHPIYDSPEPVAEKPQPAPELNLSLKIDLDIGREMYLEFLLEDLQARDFDPELLWKNYFQYLKDNHMDLLRDATLVIREYIKKVKATNDREMRERFKLLDRNYIQLHSYLHTKEAQAAPKIWRTWYLKAFKG